MTLFLLLKMQGMSMLVNLSLFLRRMFQLEGLLPVQDMLYGLCVTMFAQLVAAEYGFAAEIDVRDFLAVSVLILP